MIVRTHQSEVRRRFPQPTTPVAQKQMPARSHRRWSGDEIRTLDEHLSEGWSFSAIAKKLGRTRNSLIGFDWRRRQG